MKRYYYWIGEKNTVGGLEATGSHGEMDATSAQEVAEAVAAEGKSDDSELVVVVRPNDLSEWSGNSDYAELEF